MRNYFYDPHSMYMPPYVPHQPVFMPSGPPTSPPPHYIPEKDLYRVDPGSIRRCKHNFTYIWLNNGNSFWFYPTHIGRKSISGYRWYGFWWFYYGVDLNKIDSFVCM